MNKKQLLGTILIIGGILLEFLTDDESGGLGFLAGFSVAIGIGFLVAWLPFGRKKSVK